MEKKDTKCDGFYFENGHCEALGKVTKEDCQHCTCPTKGEKLKIDPRERHLSISLSVFEYSMIIKALQEKRVREVGNKKLDKFLKELELIDY